MGVRAAGGQVASGVVAGALGPARWFTTVA
jgi:hypothetical protein